MSSALKGITRHVAANHFNESVCARVAKILAEERERKKISLNTLAQRAGISRQTIRFIELEERNPTLITLLRIASVLDLKIEDIIARARRAVERSR